MEKKHTKFSSKIQQWKKWHQTYIIGTRETQGQSNNAFKFLRTITADPCYSQLQYLEFTCSLTFIFNVEMSTWDAFLFIQGHVQSAEKFEPCTYAQLRSTKATLCLLVPALIVQASILFTVYLVIHFSHFLYFLLVISNCLQRPPDRVGAV